MESKYVSYENGNPRHNPGKLRWKTTGFTDEIIYRIEEKTHLNLALVVALLYSEEHYFQKA
jgi:hypothetical protein